MFGFVRTIAERRRALRELGATFECAMRNGFRFGHSLKVDAS